MLSQHASHGGARRAQCAAPNNNAAVHAAALPPPPEKKVTLCAALCRVSRLSRFCAAPSDRRRSKLCNRARGHSLPQSVIVPNPNAPGVQMNRWSRWHKFAYLARYRSETAPPSA